MNPEAARKTDAKLQVDIVDELAWRPDVDASRIAVAVMKGVATLSGCVATHAARSEAEEITSRVHGVRGLVDDIVVDPPRADRRGDSDIAQAAMQALAWDSEVPDRRVFVRICEGTVILSGRVAWHFQREAARRCVSRLMGVVAVVDDIEVVPEAAHDGIVAAIDAAFRRHAAIDTRRVSVQSTNGQVTLTGAVASCAERDEAIRSAWAAQGVTGVTDKLTVAPWD